MSIDKVALITGASRGLGLALARGLAARGWSLIIDARSAEALSAAAAELSALTTVRAIAGDVAEPGHRAALVEAARDLGGLDALVNNAGALGPSPQPNLLDYPLDVLAQVYASNVFAPLGLIQAARDVIKAGAAIVNVTSDAGVEGYPGWGGYGSSKAALEQLSRVLAAEQPDWRVYWTDPGDMRTQMHQDAFPGEDISDRPLPDVSVPGLIALIEGGYPSGRYKAQSVGSAEAPKGWLNLVLTTADYDRTVAFYRDGLGYPVIEQWDETGHGVMLEVGRATLEIADRAQAAEVDRIEVGHTVGAPVRLALRVADSKTASERLETHGAKIIGEVVQTPWEHVNRRIIGPDDMQITLFQEQ
jgi:NAD(P)-dependent dehydrogenase (short-subunit alcohol dehydrogenase family)